MKVRITKRNADEIKVPIVTEYIKLEALLKLVNVAGSGGMAKNMILNEDAKVNGEICTMRGDKVELLGNTYVVTADEAQ